MLILNFEFMTTREMAAYGGLVFRTYFCKETDKIFGTFFSKQTDRIFGTIYGKQTDRIFGTFFGKQTDRTTDFRKF